MVGHVGIKVVGVFTANIRVYRRDVFIDRRAELVRIGAQKAVEVLETQTGRPQVEGACGRVLPVGHIVVFAEPRGAVAVVGKDFANGAYAARHQAVVAGEGRRELHDDAGGGHMVVAPGDQRCTRRRADRRGVEAVVAHALLGHAVKVGCWNGAAEGLGGAEAHVVHQHHQHVGSALWRLNFQRPIGLARVFYRWCKLVVLDVRLNRQMAPIWPLLRRRNV